MYRSEIANTKIASEALFQDQVYTKIKNGKLADT